MKVIADKDVIDFLKGYLLEKKKNVVRIKLAEACCGMAEFEIVYDVQKEDDICYEVDGVKFVVSNEFGFLLNNVELERTLLGVDIKRDFL